MISKNIIDYLKNLPKEKRYDFIVNFIKVILFIGLVVIEILGIITSKSLWYVTLISSVILTTFFALSCFLKVDIKKKISFYVFNFLSFTAFNIIDGNSFSPTLLNIILAEFYLDNRFFVNIFIGASMFLISGGAYITNVLITTTQKSISMAIATMLSNNLVYLILIFVLVNLISETLKTNKELTIANKELAERERKLKEANKELRETAVVKERNRIAKQIHDTTGHSITTVIMQTEGAKLLIDKNPEEAKKKIISANLQAVNALEEMRTAVHVLGGFDGGFDLKSSIIATINNTTEDSNIAIRSKLEDVNLNEEKSLFLYTSFKEGLNNGIRHGGGTAFYVELIKENDDVKFTLSDNGSGCENIKLGYGLKTMKEQAENFGGSVTLSSEIDEGFEIQITIPLNKGEL